MNNKLIICGKTEIIENEDGITTSELDSGVEIFEAMDEEEINEEKHGGVQTVLAKFMEEKQTISYKKLVVPQSMRSIYWKFFGFPANADGEILTRVKIVCLLCKTQIAYNRNTSNLRMHLQNKHTQELHDLELISPPRKQVLTPESKEKRAQKRLLKAAMANSRQHLFTTSADGTVEINGDIQFITTPNITFAEQCEEEETPARPIKVMMKKNNYNTEPTMENQNVSFVISDENQQIVGSGSKTIEEAILELIIIDLQLPDIVQEQGFQRLVATLKSPCQIPCKDKLEEEIIPKYYDNFREIISGIFSLTNDISLAIEEWTSNYGENFFTFLIYYQNPGETTLESKMLCTIHGPDEWEEPQWGNTLDSIFSDWHITVDKITAVVLSSDNGELINALIGRSLPIIPCFLHSLQVCAQACYNEDQVAKVLAKCRAIIGWISSHHEISAEFTRQEQFNDLEKNAMVMDLPSVWTSTYTMLQQMIPRREIISSILATSERNNHIVTDLDEEQWKIVNDLVEVLQPFTITILTLSEEKMPLVSLLKPLLWQLVSAHLKVSDSDSSTARLFKESLSEMLCERYSDSNVSLLLQIATTLDPRFKNVPYASDEDKKVVAKPIREKLVKLIEVYGDMGETTKNGTESPTKKIRLSGVERILGGLCANKRSMTSQQKADLELAQYESEASASLDNCPLQWWSKSSVKCPNLGILASRYNRIPACCPPPSRIPAEMQIVYNAKRAALPPHLVDKLLFLHANHNLS